MVNLQYLWVILITFFSVNNFEARRLEQMWCTHFPVTILMFQRNEFQRHNFSRYFHF